MGNAADDLENAIFAQQAKAEARHALFNCPKAVIWTDQRGNNHDIRTMNINHLKNAAKMCARKGLTDAASIMLAEIERREL